MSLTHPIFGIVRGLAFVVALAGLGLTVALVVLERTWDAENRPMATDAEAFVLGSIGTELAPVVAFETLPELFPDEFHPIDAFLKSQGVADRSAGDWIDQFGFIRQTQAPNPRGDMQLPVGFVVSRHRPGSGAGSPIPFVGLSCAACHSGEVRLDPDRPRTAHYGIGNATMNLLAFSEALRGLLVRRVDDSDPKSEYRLTLQAIVDVQAKRGRTLTMWEKTFTALWIRGARAEAGGYRNVIDEPYPPQRLFDPRFMMAGPNRTQPFRSLVRIHLDRPGWSDRGHRMDQGFSKVPAVYHQDPEYHGEWAQFDGSVNDLTARSTLAASTAGGNVHNLSRPDIASHILGAAEYTRRLAPPKWDDTFPEHALTAEQRALAAGAGAEAYRKHCGHCHGEPAGAGWTWDKQSPKNLFGAVLPLSAIGTDPERVEFRHANEVSREVAEKFGAGFRKNHPLATFKWDADPSRTNLRSTGGYYCGPIAGTFLRAPYLHNASVLTLAELVGLEPRRAKFYRGRNGYDPVKVGLASPDVPANVDRNNPKPRDRNHYFVFDTAERGNSNRGHRYPAWGHFHDDEPAKLTDAQKAELRALIEYLKTI